MPKGRRALPITHEFAEWSWNRENLMSKVELPLITDPQGCWMWMGSISPGGPLYGARKNKRVQMTQAARLIYMQEMGVDIRDSSLYRSCENPYCVRPDHMILKPNGRRGFKRKQELKQYRGRNNQV